MTHQKAEGRSFPGQFGVERVAQGLDLVIQAEETFERYADITKNRRTQAGGPILEGLARSVSSTNT